MSRPPPNLTPAQQVAFSNAERQRMQNAANIPSRQAQMQQQMSPGVSAGVARPGQPQQPLSQEALLMLQGIRPAGQPQTRGPMQQPAPRPIGGGRTPNPFTVDARPIGPGGMNPVPRPGMPGSATGPTPNIGGFPVNDRGTGSTPTPKTGLFRNPPPQTPVTTPVTVMPSMPSNYDNPVADGINWASRAGNQVGSAAGNLFGRSFFQKGGLVKKAAGGTVAAKAPVKKAAGGKVAAKPVAKKAGGKVAAKPMGKPVMKKAGGRVAAKPMAKGRKK